MHNFSLWSHSISLHYELHRHHQRSIRFFVMFRFERYMNRKQREMKQEVEIDFLDFMIVVHMA